MAASSKEHAPFEFSEVELEDARDSSKKVKFGDLWREKPLVAVFLRRWGCQICRVHAQDLESIRRDVESAGANIVCFGHERFGEGSDKDRSFEAGKYYTGPVYVDTSKTLYAQLFSRKSLWQGYGLFDMSKERLAQVKSRGVPGNFSGDGFQLGGTFVIDTDGRVALDHRQKFYGDDATNDDILEALRTCKTVSAATAAGAADGAAPAAASTAAA